ncbi:hypothetical protein Q0A17_12690 [Citrobacter sp. S2-9]|uniref:Curlin n=1 Tax=Citrobacter enshiensis TaxID=2971264 RepID=A0ABT8PVH8_9ENTR|nr:hypothetical protein [Citrobacter enshiensis]MDN8600264.1 hypothetical protein [Citrobacter enshiensis]
MHFIKLVAAFLFVISDSVFATDLTVTPAVIKTTKIYQSGAAHMQSASRHMATVEQGGVNNRVSMTQANAGNTADIKQNGHNNSLSISQNGGGDMADVQQDIATSNSDITINQGTMDLGTDSRDARTVHVQQLGATGSSVNITQNAAASAYVSQSGSQNNVTIVQR